MSEPTLKILNSKTYKLGNLEVQVEESDSKYRPTIRTEYTITRREPESSHSDFLFIDNKQDIFDLYDLLGKVVEDLGYPGKEQS